MHLFQSRAKMEACTPEAAALFDEGLFTPLASKYLAYGGRIRSCSSRRQVKFAAGPAIRCRDFQFARSPLAAPPNRLTHDRTQFARGAVTLFGLELIASRPPALAVQARSSGQRAGCFPRKWKRRRRQVEDRSPTLSICFELGGGPR